MIKNFIKISLFFYTSMIIANVNDLSIDNMSLNEKIAQMIMVRVRSDYYTSDNYYKKQVDKWNG